MMENYQTYLTKEEQKTIQLKALFHHHHFQRYYLSAFESYDLYLKSRNHQENQEIITFIGSNGQIMALQPDITLSIIKNTGENEEKRCFYDEDVYRHDYKNQEYQRIHQLGVEQIGQLTLEDEQAILKLALDSLAILGQGTIRFSHQALIDEIVSWFSFNQKPKVLQALKQKAFHELQDLTTTRAFSKENWQQFKNLLLADEMVHLQIAEALQLFQSKESQDALIELQQLLKNLPSSALGLDLSIINEEDYYSGCMFQGFLPNVAAPVLLGGRYDQLLLRQGKSQQGIGFAIYLDSQLFQETSSTSDLAKSAYIKVALPKGRMAEKVYQYFVKANLCRQNILQDNRQLIFTDEEKHLQFFLVKPSDVAIYVEHGVADIGVVGKDVLMESSPDVLELLDLQLGKCFLAVAGLNDFKIDQTRALKVATKYPQITRNYFAAKGQAVELIQLHGSIEVAPLLGLADVIVDIVETGQTLKENQLKVWQKVAPSSARLVANQSAYRFKAKVINEIVQKVAEQI